MPGQAGPGRGRLHGHSLWPSQGGSGLRGLCHFRRAGEQERIFPLRSYDLLRGGLRVLLCSDCGCRGDDCVQTDQGCLLHVLRPLRGGVHSAGSSALSECIGGVAGVLLRHQIRLPVEAVLLPSGQMSVGQ